MVFFFKRSQITSAFLHLFVGTLQLLLHAGGRLLPLLEISGKVGFELKEFSLFGLNRISLIREILVGNGQFIDLQVKLNHLLVDGSKFDFLGSQLGSLGVETHQEPTDGRFAGLFLAV